MLHVGLDLSRTRLDVHAMDEAGTSVLVTTAAPDAGGLASLVAPAGRVRPAGDGGDRVDERRPLRPRPAGAARLDGGDRRRGQGQGVRAAGVQDRQDRRLGAGRAVPPGPGAGDLAAHPGVRGDRERARWRLHLVRHRTALKNRIHATLMAFGHPCPVSDLFGVAGRRLLDGLELPEPWAGDVVAALRLIDGPRRRDRRLRGRAAQGRCRPPLRADC